MKGNNNNNNINTHEDDDDYEDDFSSKKDATFTTKDGKSNEKASALRSKHSVTEQRRRSKINERFQILRDLIPHGDQKRDTASFLLEVIDYVQLLQEKVQKYEGSDQGWGAEPTKSMPWRHSHWRVQSYLSNPHAVKNGPGPVSTFSGKFDDRGFSANQSMSTDAQAPLEMDSDPDAFSLLGQQSELNENAASLSASFQAHVPNAVRIDNDSHFSRRPATNELSAACTTRNEDQQGEHMIEGGTISVSSSYSHRLLMTLTQALQSSGVDLSEASISIRIDLGKQAKSTLRPGVSGTKGQDLDNLVTEDLNIGQVRSGSGGEESEQPQKKFKS